MRRYVKALFVIIAAFAVVGVSPGTALLGTPVLVVYPFSSNGGGVSKEAGSQLAVTIATQIANLGGVSVKPASPGIERAAYLQAAQHDGADYYVAGYVTPLGDGVSVVEQLVSTQTGIVVYSNTAQIRTFGDAAGQGDVLREALLRHQSRNLGAYAAPPPPVATPTPTPAPGSATQANIGRLFGHKQRSGASTAASASPAPSSAASASAPTNVQAMMGVVMRPAGGYGILAIGGAAQSDRRAFAVTALRNDLIAGHQRVSNAATREAACSTDGAAAVFGGNLSTRAHSLLGSHRTTATLEFLAYDCSGNVIFRKSFAQDSRGDWQDAVSGVVAGAVAEFFHQTAAGRS